DPMDRRAGNVDLEQELDPLGLRTRRDDPGQLLAQLEITARVLAELLTEVALEQIVAVDGATELLEEMTLRRLEQDGAVVGRVVVLVPNGVTHRRRCRGVASRATLSERHHGVESGGTPRDRGVGLRDVDERPFARRACTRERGEHTDRRVEPTRL